MTTHQKVLTELLGSFEASFYITYFIFVGIGLLISLLIHSKSRDKFSKHTPIKFSFWFLIRDNLVRGIASMALVFASIRFGADMFGVVPTYIGAVCMGLGFDQLVAKIKQYQLNARK